MQKPLQHLKENYENINHELYFSGISKIFQYYKGRLSKKSIEKFLSSNYTYSIYRSPKKPNRNPTYVYGKRFQFQVDLGSNFSKFGNFQMLT